jgi:WD40 repeat protein
MRLAPLILLLLQDPSELRTGSPYPNEIAFSPDGKFIACAIDDQKSRVWDLATGKLLWELEGAEEGAWSAVFSPSGKTLVTGEDAGLIFFWDPENGEVKMRLRAHRDLVTSVAFSPDGQTLASCGNDGTFRLWEAESGKNAFVSAAEEHPYTAVRFSPDGKALAIGSSDDSIRLWDVAARKERWKIHAHDQHVSALAFTPDGRFLISSGDKVVKLWDVATGKERHRLEGHADDVLSMSLSSDGRMILTSAKDNSIRLWETLTGRCILKLADHAVTIRFVAISPDGRRLASAGQDKRIVIRDAKALFRSDSQDLWKDLGDSDAQVAYRALWTIGPDAIRSGLAAVETEKIAKLLAGLEDSKTREASYRELLLIGLEIEPQVRKAIEGASDDVRPRLQALLETLNEPVIRLPGALRRLRAIQALEYSRAVEVLAWAAEKAPSERERREAKAALQRTRK